MSGVKSDITVIWLAAAIASVNLLGTLIGLYLVSRVKRRTLTLGSLACKFDRFHFVKGTFRDHSRDNALNFHTIQDLYILVMILDV